MACEKSLKKFVTSGQHRGHFTSNHLQLFTFVTLKKLCCTPKIFLRKARALPRAPFPWPIIPLSRAQIPDV
jgi:hypothetical protein